MTCQQTANPPPPDNHARSSLASLLVSMLAWLSSILFLFWRRQTSRDRLSSMEEGVEDIVEDTKMATAQRNKDIFQESAFPEMPGLERCSTAKDSGFMTMSTGPSLTSCGLNSDSSQQQGFGQAGGDGPPAERGGRDSGGNGGGGTGRRGHSGGGTSGGDGKKPPNSTSPADTDTDEDHSSESEEEDETFLKTGFKLVVVAPMQCTEDTPPQRRESNSPYPPPSALVDVREPIIQMRDGCTFISGIGKETPLVFNSGRPVDETIDLNPEPALNLRDILLEQEGDVQEELSANYGVVDLGSHSEKRDDPPPESVPIVTGVPIPAKDAGAQAEVDPIRSNARQVSRSIRPNARQALQTPYGHCSAPVTDTGETIVTNRVRPPEPTSAEVTKPIQDSAYTVGQSPSGGSHHDNFEPGQEQEKCSFCGMGAAYQWLDPCRHCVCEFCAYLYLDSDPEILQPCCPHCGSTATHRRFTRR